MQTTLRNLFCAFLLSSAASAHAQWTTQSIALRPGWNAVFLEIQPEPRECDAVFAGLPIESVWAWNRRFSPVQFIQDPSSLIPGNPDWLSYLPQGHPDSAAANLYSIEANRAYLIKLPADAGQVTWNIKGRPVLRRKDWLADSLNLTGFAVDPSNAPTFQHYFAGSPAHAGQSIYRLNPNGRWDKISQPASTLIQSGEAYWIGCSGVSEFWGPVEIQDAQRTGLDYGRTVVEHTLTLRNASPIPRTLTLKNLASAAPAAGPYPALAGPVPLSYFLMNLESDQYGWVQLPPALERLDLPPGAEWTLRLEVRRRDMANVPGALYQSVLEVADEGGARLRVPVSAYGLGAESSDGAGFSLAALGDGPAPHKHAGLWVGIATIEQVSQPSSISQPNTPLATPSEAQFRVIVHVDSQGKAQLLQRVIQMWKEATLKPDPADPSKSIVDQPGRYVLLTDESLAPQYSGAALRDGQPVGRRISSAAFAFKDPISMTGAAGFGAGKVACDVTLGFDDAQNPFKHKYHPDHNNLDERFEQTLANGIESFTVGRHIELEFSSSDPAGLALPGWGDNQLGGTYRETMTGLHRKPIYLQGTFRLQQASKVRALNDQN